VTGPALSQRRVAIVSSAGLVVRGEDPFRGRDPHYHAIPATTPPEDLLCSHISINFDRTGLQEDWNVAFPIDRLRELAAEGTIGSMADTHYSFMGATDPLQMEPHARELAGRLTYLGRLGQVERGKWLISLDQTPEGLHYAGDDGAI
jgi:D-proline reductase (dithiol) PrdB